MLQINHTWTELTGYQQADIPTIAEWTKRAYGDRQAPVQKSIQRLYELTGRVSEGEYTITTAASATRV
jgi:hypothetical protein